MSLAVQVLWYYQCVCTQGDGKFLFPIFPSGAFKLVALLLWFNECLSLSGKTKRMRSELCCAGHIVSKAGMSLSSPMV